MAPAPCVPILEQHQPPRLSVQLLEMQLGHACAALSCTICKSDGSPATYT
eukprot:CAMPEP_0183366490 /NCGR_PEP_ID=MMETSP0164_2-20130417/88842_1 /TAXON_ID=221442 /ORGANISM="Coccolithus pelagicus ssp braarudi, Strain PLY182g" /LENGTH=49 /DNA_ID= /DNA_START= /DNA_END= /DNA_ORIENTATION=